MARMKTDSRDHRVSFLTRPRGLVLVMIGWSVLAIGSPAYCQQGSAREAIPNGSSITFTEVPAMLGHTSNTCERAMTLAGPIEFRTQVLHTGGSQAYGTQF